MPDSYTWDEDTDKTTVYTDCDDENHEPMYLDPDDEEGPFLMVVNQFYQYYGSRISNVENILKLFREGMRMVEDDSDWSEFCSTLVKTGMLQYATNPECGYALVILCSKNRNLSLFLYHWCPEFAILALNCMLLQGNINLLYITNAMPNKDKKFSNYVTNSPLLETALSKFLEHEQTDDLNFVALILVSVLVHREQSENLALTSKKKKLMRKVNKKINNLLKRRDVSSDKRGWFNNLKTFLEKLLKGRENHLKLKILSKKMKETWREQFKSICRNKTCSKSMISDAKYCSRCCYTSYCSVECQKMDWSIHRKKCKNMYCKVGKLLTPFFECGVVKNFENIS